MAASSTSWMPPAGRHTVDIGPSLGRALKARKGGAAPTKSKIPDRDFYSFRYNFKPESVDATRPGTIEVKRGKDATNVTVERASSQVEDGGHLFVGQEHASKEWDCVLIYDEEMGTYTLEKMDSFLNLTYDKKITRAPRHPGSPLPATRVAGSSSTTNHSHPIATAHVPATSKSHVDLDLEAELLEGLEDALGSPDDEAPLASQVPVPSKTKVKAPVRPKFVKTDKAKKELSQADKASLRKEEEESEGEIIEPLRPPSTLPERPSEPSSVPKAKPKLTKRPRPEAPLSQPQSVMATPRQTHVPVPVTSPALPKVKPATGTPSNKRAHPPSVEEEVLEFSQPTRPAKRSRPSPPPVLQKEKDSFDLALPSSSSKMSSLPTEPVALSLPGPSTAISLPSAQPVHTTSLDSDEEEWDEIPAPVVPPAPRVVEPPPLTRTIMMEEIDPAAEAADEDDEDEDMEEMEIDMNAFEAEMNQQLGGAQEVEVEPVEDEPDDFLAGAISPVADRPSGGGASAIDWGDDEDFSSSDESDED
ncbi:uncharacterized protein FIBRA_07892 [Fibroporia radiculosa]|uniref:Transcription elongation factor Eaf N-terminal domain-containing protein n=1 Tax=Fibroporia radiculosa TaxID=599839 RepID=J4I1L5_9APHY|nr:uncharacterized protein FIBRA_07892 [Fibroporia radiculosa]CCM05662.1 predicted protein [Fibroporia radiculosa]